MIYTENKYTLYSIWFFFSTYTHRPEITDGKSKGDLCARRRGKKKREVAHSVKINKYTWFYEITRASDWYLRFSPSFITLYTSLACIYVRVFPTSAQWQACECERDRFLAREREVDFQSVDSSEQNKQDLLQDWHARASYIPIAGDIYTRAHCLLAHNSL